MKFYILLKCLFNNQQGCWTFKKSHYIYILSIKHCTKITTHKKRQPYYMMQHVKWLNQKTEPLLFECFLAENV